MPVYFILDRFARYQPRNTRYKMLQDDLATFLRRHEIKRGTGCWEDYDRAKALVMKAFPAPLHNEAIPIVMNWIGVK